MITTITITIDHDKLSNPRTSNSVQRRISPYNLCHPGNGAISDLSEAMEQLGPQCVKIEHAMGWVSGWNIPGCLPEEDTIKAQTFGEACDHLIESLTSARIEHAAQVPNPNNTIAMYDEAIAQVRRQTAFEEHEAEPFWLRVGNYAWWVAREQH